MKLAVSNIAWPREQDAAVAEVLRAHGITGVEIAPTKAWPDPAAATDAEVDAYRRSWNERGLKVVAAQALLFGHPELTIFESAEVRQRTLDHLSRVVRACARAGAKALVFGSPKNRRIGPLAAREVQEVARQFFRRLGEVAAEAGTSVVMEANPPQYGADFVTRAADAVELVRAVDHPGFRLHLDSACMALAGDPVRETFDAGFPLLRHAHVSEPNLAVPGGASVVDHAAFAGELAARRYAGWVSLEMREPEPFTLDALAAAVRWFAATYRPSA